MKRVLTILFAASLTVLFAARSGGAQVVPPRSPGTALNFVDARLSEVIRSLGLTLGLNVVLTDVPDKRITFTTAGPVAQQDVSAILESILESSGLTLIQKGA
ncbi:MAG TPA: hypothetical protein VHM24_12020, partial [Gemmatimonadaceae bacterium]|nr:hypothetical protein [Gemmatimonadaceae bacterium]